MAKIAISPDILRIIETYFSIFHTHFLNATLAYWAVRRQYWSMRQHSLYSSHDCEANSTIAPQLIFFMCSCCWTI